LWWKNEKGLAAIGKKLSKEKGAAANSVGGNPVVGSGTATTMVLARPKRGRKKTGELGSRKIGPRDVACLCCRSGDDKQGILGKGRKKGEKDQNQFSARAIPVKKQTTAGRERLGLPELEKKISAQGRE